MTTEQNDGMWIETSDPGASGNGEELQAEIDYADWQLAEEGLEITEPEVLSQLVNLPKGLKLVKLASSSRGGWEYEVRTTKSDALAVEVTLPMGFDIDEVVKLQQQLEMAVKAMDLTKATQRVVIEDKSKSSIGRSSW